MTTKPLSIDFTLVGGGLVGSLLALLLAERGYSVALIEHQKASLPQSDHPLDTRALALNYGTISLLKTWGFGDLLAEATFIKRIHVSDKGQRGIVHIEAEQENLPFLGAVIPFEHLVYQLQQKVLVHPKIRFIEGSISYFEEKEDYVLVTVIPAQAGLQQSAPTTLDAGLCRDDMLFQSKVLIGADGAHSFLRQALNIPAEEYDYGTSAYIGKVRVKKQISDCAYERFTKQGPIALLPAGEGLYTLVWVKQNSYTEVQETDFLKSLQEAFGYRAGIFTEQGIIKTYPLKRMLAQKTYQGRIGLLGNAAHSIHPVAGQGFNLAVRDLLTFLEVLDMQKALDASLWKTYSERAEFQQKTIEKLTHGFVKVFENTNPLVTRGRNLLLGLLEWNQFGRSELNNVMVGRF